ncbi:uncharacterized protein Dana_GF27309, partial [Drosophila ananassae]
MFSSMRGSTTMFSFTPSKLKWLLLCFLAVIVTLSLLSRN